MNRPIDCAVGKYHYKTYEWFAQDNWKVRPNLSIDYGMRFSVIQPWYDDENQIAGFDPTKYKLADQVVLYVPALNAQGKRVAKNPITGQLESTAALIGAIVPGSGDPYNGIAVAGKNGVPRGLIDSRGVQFGPRFGIAWTPWGVGFQDRNPRRRRRVLRKNHGEHDLQPDHRTSRCHHSEDVLRQPERHLQAGGSPIPDDDVLGAFSRRQTADRL